jgi:PAS domain S-box-containing protein
MADETLRESEEHFRSLVENMTDVTIRYDLDLRYRYISSSFARLMDVDPASLIGKTHREAGFPEELADFFDDALKRALGSRKAIEVEFTIQGRDGELVAAARVFPEFDAEGRPCSVVTLTRDITAQRRILDDLRESEEKYREVVERASDGIVIGREERVLFANAAFARMTGYTLEELEDISLLELVRQDEQAELSDLAHSRLAGEDAPSSYESEIVRKDGSVIFTEVQATVVAYRGEPAIVAVVRDVTERKRAERALRETAAMRDIAETVAHVGSWRWEVPSRQSHWSPEMMRLFDVDPATFDHDVEPILEARVHPDDLAHLQQITDGVLETGEPMPVEFRVVHRDGTEHILHGEGMAERDADGTVVAITGYYADVTEQRSAEAEILHLNAQLEARVASRSEQLEAATRELEAFAYSISHDVRAPLRAIDGFSAMVLADSGPELGAETSDHLRRIREAAQRMGRLIDDLLGLSRVSERDLRRETVDLSGLAESVAAELQEEQPGRAVDCLVEPGLTAEADPVLTRLILRELLGNAWKFTSKHAEARVEVGATGAGEEHAFYVRDDGAGFDMRYADHLFGAFQRMHPADQFEGDGVGLATVQRLVRRHGGRVWAEAEAEKGATFYFTLPEPAIQS